MLLKEKTKLNKFRQVEIPTTKQLYMRGMPQITMPSGAYTGDNEQVPEIGNDKVRTLYTAEEYAKYEAMMAERERREAEAAAAAEAAKAAEAKKTE